MTQTDQPEQPTLLSSPDYSMSVNVIKPRAPQYFGCFGGEDADKDTAEVRKPRS